MPVRRPGSRIVVAPVGRDVLGLDRRACVLERSVDGLGGDRRVEHEVLVYAKALSQRLTGDHVAERLRHEHALGGSGLRALHERLERGAGPERLIHVLLIVEAVERIAQPRAFDARCR